jgi:hypothetical protein
MKIVPDSARFIQQDSGLRVTPPIACAWLAASTVVIQG